MFDTDLLTLFRLLANRPRPLARLLEQYGSATRVIEHASSPSLERLSLTRGSLDRCRLDFRRQVDSDVAWLEKPNHHLIVLDSELYPPQLKAIHDPPVLLFASGNQDVLELPAVAMVGSRSPSRLGVATAESLAAGLTRAGFAVVSGMALGIDGASHRGALRAKERTVAVFGTGCDLAYPAQHRRLAAEIAARGLILSEFPLGAEARPWHFPRRNRVVTGLSLGTIVVEAALPSGSLISARYSLEQGREVFAVPGPVNSRQSRGCHQLLREGATLVESLDDVLEGLCFVSNHCPVEAAAPSLNETQALVLKELDSQPQSVDALAVALALPVEKVVSTLTELEILGVATQEQSGYARS